MGDFKKAMAFTLKQEGGYAKVTGDAGGETYCGISRNAYPNWEGWAGVDMHKPLKRGQVIDDGTLMESVETFYYKMKWVPALLDEVADDGVAGFIFDFYVNSGGALKATQREVGVTADGDFGPKTIAAINGAQNLLARLKAARIAYLEKLVFIHPSYAEFMPDWLRRVNDYPY